MGRGLRTVALLAAGIVLAALGLALPTRAGTPGPTAAFVLPDVTLIEPGRSRLAARTLEIRDGRIVAAAARPGETSGGAPVLEEYAGTYVLPGLIDMHVHYWSEEPELFGLLLLAHGVTTVRDVGDSEGAIFETRARIEDGEIPGPRVFACGPILDGPDPVWPRSIGLAGPGEAARAVRELARRGADCIKVYHGVAAPVLDAIRSAAHDEGLPVIGHVPASVRIEEAGLDDVQHLSGVPGRVEDPDAPFRERLEAEATAWRTLAPGRIDAVVRHARAAGTAHTPTLVFHERLFRLRPEDAALTRAIPPWHRELFWDPSRPWNRTPRDRRELGEALGRMKEVVARLHQAGVRLHAGTDTLNPFVAPGGSLHDEISHLAGAGLTPAAALAAATWVAAESLGHPELGSLAAGSAADFVIYRRDPTRNTAALDTPVAVVTRGRLWTREELERRTRAWRRWFENPVVATVTSTLAKIAAALDLRERRL